ncbi:F-BAR domain only protein 1 [Sciurus carolinensis]|uniref:F-BAR domain only protein 1 n=1 Tax=Sciurus carolinensis TaxID=30640 RepID=A0AA41SQV5_SCICA|nr:F-BAR domain only protein 1 [Sciurus carolinensis]
MLAWVTVPGAASPEDPRGSEPCRGCLPSPHFDPGGPRPALCQPHFAKTLGSWVVSLLDKELRPREVKSPTQRHPAHGEKNHGFEVLYHSVKQGPISTKELADFIRERATIEETYSKAMAKLSKLASNGTPMGTFAPLWEVFRVSSDKLALCHLELTRKLQDLIKDVLRYGEEQLKTHKKCKEEALGTLDAVQVLAGVSQLLPKSRENYLSRCMDQERLRRENTSQKEMDKAETKTKKAAESLRRAVEKYNSARADFEHKMLDSARRFQAMEESHLRHMKALLGSYAHSVEDTHVQIGQVHEEFKQNIENVSVEMLLRKFAESKGTGREKPGPLDFETYSAAVLQEGKYVWAWLPRLDRGWRRRICVGGAPTGLSPLHLSSAMKRLRGSKAFRLPGLSRREREPPAAVTAEPSRFSSSDSDFDDEEPRKFHVHIKPAPARAPSCSSEAAAAQLRATAGSLILPPGPGGTMKRHSSRDTAGKPQRPRSAPRTSSCAEKLPLDEQVSKNLFGPPLESAFDHEDFTGVSRGPSPVVLGSQDALPVATAFTEYVHAYFRGHSPSCLARVTGELTMTFPAGIMRVFSGTPPPPVLSFRLIHTAPIEHFQPSADLLFSDPSQSDPDTKDFWLNMAALTEALQRQAEQNPTASYYNVVLLRYQFSRPGPQSLPLQLSVHWQCGTSLTQVSVEYSYRAGATAVSTPLTNFQILLPVGEPVTNVRLQPAATWSLEEKRFMWKLPDVCEAGGSGHLSASWEPLSGPSAPSPVAAQFTSEGATLSGVDLELVGSGYRMSLVKRRFATGMYLVSC